MAKGLDVRDFTLTTFGGSGSLLACRLMDILGLPRTLVPPNPGNVSAFGLLTVDVRNDYVQTVVAKHADLDLDRVRSVYADLEGQAQTALDGEGFGRDEQRMQRTADLRYVGQAFEVRVPVADGDLDAAATEEVAQAFHAAHRQLYGYDFADRPAPGGRVGEPAGERDRADPPSRHGGAARRATAGRTGPSRARAGCSSTTGSTPRPTTGPTWRPGDVVTGPAIIEEFGSTVPGAPGLRRHRRRLRQPAAHEGGLGADGRTSATKSSHQGGRRPGPRRDRRRHAGRDREGGRDLHRPHLALADDPGRARLPRRHPRPEAAQAHRPLVLGARAPGGARLPDRDDEHRRRLLPQRRLPLRRRHRPPARPVRHRAGVRRRTARRAEPRGRGLHPGVRPPRRHRRRRARLDAERGHQRVRGGPDGPPDQAVGPRRAQRVGAEDHDPQLADARLAGRRPRRRVLGLPGGRPAARRAVRPVRRRRGRGLLRRDPGQLHRGLPARDPVARSPTAPTSGRTTPSTTASRSRSCTASGSR